MHAVDTSITWPGIPSPVARGERGTAPRRTPAPVQDPTAARPPTADEEARQKAALAVGLAGTVLLTPLAVDHLEGGRLALGVGAAAVVLVLAAMAWSGHRGRELPLSTFTALTPAVLAFLFVAAREQGLVGMLWCYPALLLLYFTLPERQAWAANGALLALALPTAWTVLPRSLWAGVGSTLVGASAFTAIFVHVIGQQRRALEERAVTDPLTGLHNRSLLFSTLERAVEQSRRAAIPMTLLAIDLDHFKRINDTHGHDAGDAVLRGVADILRARLRRSDVAFRVGGEEFLVFLYGTAEEQALRVAENLRAAVAQADLLPGRTITASVGVASVGDDADWEAWMKRSDEKLYEAKTGGRNRVAA